MPGPLVPLIVGGLGAGARILAGQAARQGATRAASTAARGAAKKTAKKAPAAKRTTAKRTPAKTTTAKRTPAKRTPATKTTAAKRTPGMRTAREPKWVSSYGTKKPSQVTIRVTAKDRQQTARLQSMLSQTKANKAKYGKLKKVAVSTGASAVATEAGIYAYKRSTGRNTKNQMPIRPRNWNPNKGR